MNSRRRSQSGDEQIREEARKLLRVFQGDEGPVSVNPGAVVSRTGAGAYVQAWVWVPAKGAAFITDADPGDETEKAA